MAHSTLTGIIDAVAKTTGRRYCTHHGGEVDASAGCLVARNKTKRWMCYVCQNKSAKRNAEIRAHSSFVELEQLSGSDK